MRKSIRTDSQILSSLGGLTSLPNLTEITYILTTRKVVISIGEPSHGVTSIRVIYRDDSAAADPNMAAHQEEIARFLSHLRERLL